MTAIGAVPAGRRHTLHFLRALRSVSPVYLDTEVDAGPLLAHRNAADRRYSTVTCVLWAVGRVLATHTDANRAYRGGPFPRLATHEHVDAKLTLDKPGVGERSVLSVVLPGVDAATLDDIQDTVDRLRADEPADIPELRGTLALQRLPMPVGWLAFRLATRLRHRHRRLGTVAVTSLGHRPVIRFFSCGGTAITVGIGRIRDVPMVRDNAVVVAPSLPLSLTFDHRVLDGALAADVLTDLKRTLETFDASRPGPIRVPDGTARSGAVARAGTGHHTG